MPGLLECERVGTGLIGIIGFPHLRQKRLRYGAPSIGCTIYECIGIPAPVRQLS